jgi:NADH-quinone oxidoreductase subunit F
MELVLHRIEQGQGTDEDGQLLLSICGHICGQSLCPLGDAAIGPVKSLVERFSHEIAAHLREKRCPYPHRRHFG